MQYDSTVPVPQVSGGSKVPSAPVQPGKNIKGFGSGSMDSSLCKGDTVTIGRDKQGAVKGFTGSGVKGGKV